MLTQAKTDVEAGTFLILNDQVSGSGITGQEPLTTIRYLNTKLLLFGFFPFVKDTLIPTLYKDASHASWLPKLSVYSGSLYGSNVMLFMEEESNLNLRLRV